MNNFKILTTRGRYDDLEIECFSSEQLSNQDRIIVASEMAKYLNSEDQLKILQGLSIDEKTFGKYVKDLGYLPATRIEKIPEATIVEPNRLYYNNIYGNFSPCGKSSYNEQEALKSTKYYVQVELSDKHPFSIARKNFLKKKEEEKQERLEKKKAKEIEKAKKLLQELEK